jgi:hypothetical protein
MFEHARTFFGAKIRDLSESGLGGLVVDTCAMVGDSLRSLIFAPKNVLACSNISLR